MAEEECDGTSTADFPALWPKIEKMVETYETLLKRSAQLLYSTVFTLF